MEQMMTSLVKISVFYCCIAVSITLATTEKSLARPQAQAQEHPVVARKNASLGQLKHLPCRLNQVRHFLCQGITHLSRPPLRWLKARCDQTRRLMISTWQKSSGAWANFLKRYSHRAVERAHLASPSPSSVIDAYIGTCPNTQTVSDFCGYRLREPRRTAQVDTKRESLRQYLDSRDSQGNTIGNSTIELIYNPHASQFGHMLMRVGTQLFDLGNTRSAGDRDYASRLSGWSDLVGMVYQVDPQGIPRLKEKLSNLVSGVNLNNLPTFDAYGSPVTAKPSPYGGYDIQESGMQFCASGRVNARLVKIDNRNYLKARDRDLLWPVDSVSADGTIRYSSLNCTNFLTSHLREFAGELGLTNPPSGGAATAFTSTYVRGNPAKAPDLITVYTSQNHVNLKSAINHAIDR